MSPDSRERPVSHAVLAAIAVAGAAAIVTPAAADPQRPVTFSRTICQDIVLRHLLYLPAGYDRDTARTWPLILFLHGSGERGNELERVKTNGLPKELAVGREVPAIVLSPQCPAEKEWPDDGMVAGLNALLDDALERYRVDPDRVYVTGLSLGGHGTWALAASRPDRFAAIAPVCGAGHPDAAVRLRRLPVWAFHGTKDDVVPLEAMQRMAEAMARVHGDMRTTVYPDAGHDSWTATYSNPDFYAWLLSQRRKPSPVVRPPGTRLTASSGDAAKAFDGDLATRWESEWSDPQRLEIDLGAPTPIRRMVIYWETAHGKVYDVSSARSERGRITRVTSVVAGDGAVDVVEFSAGAVVRRLRLDLKERGTQWGYSIWEIELE